MKKIQYRYEEIKHKLDEKWVSPRGPERFKELKKKCQIYREQTGESFYAYHAVVLVYDIGPDGGRHSYKNAAKIINSKIIREPKAWLTDSMTHDQKYVGLFLLGINVEYNVKTQREAQKVENSWRKYQRIQEIKKEILETEETANAAKPEKEWESKIISDVEKHLQWIEAERSQFTPIVDKLQQELASYQNHLDKIQGLLEIEQEELKLLKQLNQNLDHKYLRNIIMAPD